LHDILKEHDTAISPINSNNDAGSIINPKFSHRLCGTSSRIHLGVNSTVRLDHHNKSRIIVVARGIEEELGLIAANLGRFATTGGLRVEELAGVQVGAEVFESVELKCSSGIARQKVLTLIPRKREVRLNDAAS
jgi:hypothetical protein